MISAPRNTDREAFELASRTADAQKERLPQGQRSQISDADLQTGETWFVWGFYSAMTDDIQRRKQLLANYVKTKFAGGQDTEQRVEEIVKLAAQENRLFDAIAAAGRQAYREDGDGHLANIATIFLNLMRTH